MTALLSYFQTRLPFASIPFPWQMTFQAAATPLMEKIVQMHDFLLIIVTGIASFVVVLLGYTLIRFRASRNPVPSSRSHHLFLEIVWTLIPLAIVGVIAVPSLKLMFFASHIENADITIKAVGHQWYWSYEYPESSIRFDSLMIPDKELMPTHHRLLDVDHPIVVPVGKSVRLLVTSEDVLHSFAVPSLGVKKDAVPGRLNETWFQIKKEGIYYGQCSELCGVNHGFMPIAIHVVSEPAYETWIQSQKKS